MIHLTLNEWSSRPLCGVAKNSVDSFFHAVYNPIDELRANICPTCLSVWDSFDVRYHLEHVRTGYHAWVTINDLAIATATFTESSHKYPRQSAQQWLQSKGAKI